MSEDTELVDRIRGFGTTEVDAVVFRILPSSVPADRENILGARWNPRGTRAIYTSFEPATARAEVAFRIALEPVPMKDIPRTEYRIEIKLRSVVDLKTDSFQSVGISQLEFDGLDYAVTQAVGGAVVALGRDGLIVPSARASGSNLVIYPQNAGPDYFYKVIAEAPIKF